jgi:hypothetical protein
MQQHGKPTIVDELFFLFSSLEMKKRSHIASNRVQNSFFDHDRHSLTDFLDQLLIGGGTSSLGRIKHFN